MQLTFTDRNGSTRRDVTVDRTVIAGWTGRNQAAMEHHIAELAALGVPRPARTPMYYRVACSRLTLADAIEVCGTDSSGEVEFVLLKLDGTLWIGIGSDHTDRKLETVGVTLSKQICDKPIGHEWWPLADVLPHWERLVLRAFIEENGQRVLYQEGPVTTMRDPADLIRGWEAEAGPLADGTAMFCGTLAAIGGVRHAGAFSFELEDPVLGRTLRQGYRVDVLPVE